MSLPSNILHNLGLNDVDARGEVLNIYEFGSRVYGTGGPKSDYDYIVVLKGHNNISDVKHYGFVDGTIYDEASFEVAIDHHEVSVLECLFLPNAHIIRECRKFNFIIDPTRLRESFSSKASNSFVKAKKKFTVDKDKNPYIAKKSLWHSIRILKFGIQIAINGRIVNYSEANPIWEAIRDNSSDDWEDYKRTYQPIYNETKSRFKEVAPRVY